MVRLIFGLVLGLLIALPAFSDDYVIGDGDTLKISVWGVPELSSEMVVRPDGKITLPAVGDVEATGLTPNQLSQDLNKVLDSYVKKPIVTVAVANVTNNRVYVSGGGVPSRIINLTGRTTLFKLLASLEGIENADLDRGYLVRNGERHDADIYDLFYNGNLDEDIKLQPEDILFLPDNTKNKVYVVGAVNEPKYVIYRDGLRILDAIFECGGFNKYAKQSAVLILRQGEDGKMRRLQINIEDLMKEGDLAQNLELARGDYVIVKEGFF